MGGRSSWPIWQITASRVKEFLRAPAAIFWVYGFSILMMLSLGTAFRDNPREEIRVDLVQLENDKLGDENRPSPLASLERTLQSNPSFKLKVHPTESWQKRLQSGKTDLVVEITSSGDGEYRIL